ncbi:unnamed protein product [Effrenium voratum]|uniref:Transmembrane protein n=1 Tax=Effrenium voratum TaxID=2562239 RepID=A0AA36N499_9DINO|nr:unnamed protein product [Effrenium voratum]
MELFIEYAFYHGERAAKYVRARPVPTAFGVVGCSFVFLLLLGTMQGGAVVQATSGGGAIVEPPPAVSPGRRDMSAEMSTKASKLESRKRHRREAEELQGSPAASSDEEEELGKRKDQGDPDSLDQGDPDSKEPILDPEGMRAPSLGATGMAGFEMEASGSKSSFGSRLNDDLASAESDKAFGADVVEPRAKVDGGEEETAKTSPYSSSRSASSGQGESNGFGNSPSSFGSALAAEVAARPAEAKPMILEAALGLTRRLELTMWTGLSLAPNCRNSLKAASRIARKWAKRRLRGRRSPAGERQRHHPTSAAPTAPAAIKAEASLLAAVPAALSAEVKPLILEEALSLTRHLGLMMRTG